MEPSNLKVDAGTFEYYMNRLIQRAIVEPKPLLKIYEEECQRHPDISVTVTFKEFQAALQRHCMTLQSRQQSPAALQVKQDYNARFTHAGDIPNQKKRRRSADVHSQNYQRMQQISLERYSPQGPPRYGRNEHSSPSVVNIKTEQPTYTVTAPVQQPTHSSSRPASVQPPVEEEPPPEFIEMSSHPPRLTSISNIFQNSLRDQTNVSSDTANGVLCKTEPNKTDGGRSGTVDGAVQSSSPLDKTLTLCAENISPLNVRCVKCINAQVTCAVMPCGHCCLCSICGQTVLSLKQVCPVCRKTISTVIGYSNLIYNVYR